MRSFQFRLESLRRIKRYKIEEAEREISRLENEVQYRLGLIEEGRRRVAEFQRFLMQEVPDVHSVEWESAEAAFRAYMMSEEARRFREIAEVRKQQEEKHKELVALYQEEKMLGRLKERQRVAWRKESLREEISLLDEMGGQAHFRQRKPVGGALLIILGLVALLGAAGGILVALGKHKPILERFGLIKPPTPAAATGEISVAGKPGEYSIRDLIGDVNRPANVVLDEVLKMKQTLRENELKINEERERLKAERESLLANEKKLGDKISDIEAKTKALENLVKAEQERKATQHMQRVGEVSNALQRMKPKGAAELLTQMWKTNPAQDPDAKDVVLDVFRSIPSAKRNKILDSLVKSSKQDAADMVLKFIQIEPSVTPTPTPPATQ